MLLEITAAAGYSNLVTFRMTNYVLNYPLFIRFGHKSNNQLTAE